MDGVNGAQTQSFTTRPITQKIFENMGNSNKQILNENTAMQIPDNFTIEEIWEFADSLPAELLHLNNPPNSTHTLFNPLPGDCASPKLCNTHAAQNLAPDEYQLYEHFYKKITISPQFPHLTDKSPLGIQARYKIIRGLALDTTRKHLKVGGSVKDHPLVSKDGNGNFRVIKKASRHQTRADTSIKVSKLARSDKT